MSEIINKKYTVYRPVATCFIEAVSEKDLPVQVNLGIPFKDANGTVQCNLLLSYKAIYKDEICEALNEAFNKVARENL